MRLNFVVKVDQDFVQRQFAMEHDAAGIERLGVIHRAALFHDELEDVADALVRAKHVGAHDRLADFLNDARVGQVRRIIHRHGLAPRGQDFVNDAGRRRDDVHVVLAPEPLLDDLHVEQPEEAAAESEAERDRAFRLIDESGIVQAQLPDRGLEMLEVRGVNRINAAENHRMDFLETGERLGRGIAQVGNGVADLDVGGGFDVGDEIADIARVQFRLRKHLRSEDAHFFDLVARVVVHQPHLLALDDAARHDAHVGDDAAVNIEDGIEDERAEGVVFRLDRRRDAMHDRFQNFLDPDPHLRAAIDRFLRGDLQDLLDLLVHRGDVGVRQIDLVDHRHDRQALLVREVNVGHRLRFHALRGVHD